MSDFFELLVTEATEFLAPLDAAADDERARYDLLYALDLDLDQAQLRSLSDRFQSFQTAITEIQDLADGLSDGQSGGSMDDILNALDVIAALMEAIQGIDDDLPDDVPADIGQELLEHLVVRYLFVERPKVLHGLVLLTIVDLPTPGTDVSTQRRSAYPLELPPGATVEFQRIGDLLSDPIGTLQSAYGEGGLADPADVAALGEAVLPTIAGVFGLLDFQLAYGRDVELVENYRGVQGLTLASRSLTVRKELGSTGTIGARFALGISDDGVCLIVVPMGTASIEHEADEWKTTLSIGAGFDVVVLNTGGIAHAEPETGEVSGTLAVDKRPGQESDAAFLFGPADGTRLEIGRAGVESSITASNGEVEFQAEANAGDTTLAVSPGDGDSFLQKMLPEEGVDVTFDAGVGWGTDRGLYFSGGGAGLDTKLPVNLDIGGVVQVETLRLAATPDQSGDTVTVPVRIAADPQLTIGPMDAVVEGIGLEAEIGFPPDNSGNLGPVSVDLGFKPPTGAGMSLDAGVVTGGGFLTFDYENEQYAGVLQLKIGELTITAVGLLTTQLPNGRDGFSLLLIIAGEFPAFQLGFGFTLDGLGGLIGANRSIDVDYLTAGLSDGTVGSIMFPDDPVRNAPQIISDLRNGFPVATGTHVIGPMAKLGWGTPSMLSASLGVLLDVPSPVRIVLLGRVHVGLPHEEVGITVFNMDLLGAVDVEAQQANGAASLYDSRIVAYVITGDMAVKTGWGDNATFVLSVGGFNPRFEPPDDFPSLDRIALSIGPGNPEVRLAGYFAVTSNTVQVGARVEAYAAAAGFSFRGKIGFDTLFRFQPFELIADFYAGFSLKRGGSTLMCVDVDGTLKGPGPWSLRGTASFKIWPVNFSVSIDAEFGPSNSADELSPADVFGQVVAGLSDSRNWTAQRPAGGESLVTLRDVKRGDDSVLAHPLGRIAVRQRIAPLAVRIEKFGNGTPAGYDRYEISGATVGETDETGETTRERFAPAEYFDRSEAGKLEGPEFERYTAGWRLGNTAFAFGGSGDDEALLADGVLDYETAVVDERASLFPVSVGRIAMPASTATALASVSAVARGDLRTTGEARFEATDESTGPTGVETSLSVGDAQYVVVTTSDMTRLDVDGVPADGTTKREAREALEGYLETNADDRGEYRVVATHEAADGGQA